MSTLGKTSGAYKGGSPRVQNPNSKKTSNPADLYGESTSMYIGLIKGLYLNNQMSVEDVNHFISLLSKLKSNTPYTLDVELSNYIPTFFNPISKMYKDGNINDDFITNVISGVTSILELIPFPIQSKIIKDKLSVGDNIKNASRVQNTKPKSTIDRSIKSQELDEVIKVIDNKFIQCELTKDNINSFISYLNHLSSPETPLNVTPLPEFLTKSILHIEGLYSSNKLTTSNIGYLVASLQNTLELEQIQKPTKQIKDKISAISTGYKK